MTGGNGEGSGGSGAGNGGGSGGSGAGNGGSGGGGPGSGLNGENAEFSINAARINKFPPFWPEDPEIWFAQIEALFNIHNITTDNTKFDYVLAHSTAELFPYVTTLIKEELPAGETKFKKFKERVIQSFSTSAEVKLRKLFKGQDLGGKKPTQFLVLLKNNSGGQCNDTVLKSLFLEHLPENVRSILAVSNTTDLDNLALLADKIMENQSAPMMVNAVKCTKEDSELSTLVKQLSAQVQRLTTQVNNRSRSQSRNRYDNKNSNSNNNTSTDANVSTGRRLCYYHKRFKTLARVCKPPCDWKPTKEAQEN